MLMIFIYSIFQKYSRQKERFLKKKRMGVHQNFV